MIEFQAESRTATGYIALPQSGEGPGVLVLHAWWGLNDFFRGVCERLASAGFVALAPDLYHGQTASTIDEAEQLSDTLTRDEAIQTIIGAIHYLRKLPNITGDTIGAIGFSMGGAFALSMSTARQDIAAVVTFYGLELGPDYNVAQAAYLGHFAEHDEWESAEDVVKIEKILRTAGKEVTFYTYPGAKH